MVETDVKIPVEFQSGQQTINVVEIVERSCGMEALTCTMKGTLAGYPGCVHWHWKKGKETGTLEISWWAQRKRLWFKVASGRGGSWIEETVVRLKRQIECELQVEIVLEAVTKCEHKSSDYL